MRRGGRVSHEGYYAPVDTGLPTIREAEIILIKPPIENFLQVSKHVKNRPSGKLLHEFPINITTSALQRSVILSFKYSLQTL